MPKLLLPKNLMEIQSPGAAVEIGPMATSLRDYLGAALNFKLEA
jgi:hypothetical protein